jgi:DnaJ-domain-containing protein 1
VSIGRRLIDLVRSNLGSLFDTQVEGEAPKQPIEDLPDEELENELRRRQARREAAERAADLSIEKDAWREVEQAIQDGTGRYRTSGKRGSSSRRSPSGASPTSNGSRGAPSGASVRRDPRLAQLYAQLECPYGSDITTVRKHYRTLMLKYHPDMHSRSAEKQRIATELTQRLTMAYNELRRRLSPSAS